MKKKLLFLAAAFALFVPRVMAAEPTYDEANKIFFANGTPITIEKRSDNVEGALVKWEGGKKLLSSTDSVFGGSHESD